MASIDTQVLLMGGLAFVIAASAAAAAMASRLQRRKRVATQIQGVATVSVPSAPGALVGTLASLGQHVGAGKVSGNLRRELIRAGFHGSGAVRIYMGAKVLLMFSGVVILLFSLLPIGLPVSKLLLLTGLGAGICYFTPNVYVARRSRLRAAEVHEHLPDAMDLLEICVSSGMGLDAAWNAVAGEMRIVSMVLADEMALTNQETHLGVTRAEALRHMADRTRDDDISSFVSIVVQAERFGTSIADALVSFAVGMREIRSQHAEEVAEKVAVKLILPMVVFIFPAMLLVVAGPAGISLCRVLGS